MYSRFFLFASSLAATALTASALPYALDFSNIDGSVIRFTGAAGDGNDTIQFLPENVGYDFEITASDGGTLDGLFGKIEGTFFIGATTSLGGGAESASVTGTGLLKIDAPGAGTLTANLSLLSIWDVDAGRVAFGAVNDEGEVNLTNLSYSGNASTPAGQLLQSFAADTESFGTLLATFQFVVNGPSLSQLKSPGSVRETSYSGSLEFDTTADTPIPEPSTYAALTGLVVLGAVLRRRIRRA